MSRANILHPSHLRRRRRSRRPAPVALGLLLIAATTACSNSASRSDESTRAGTSDRTEVSETPATVTPDGSDAPPATDTANTASTANTETASPGSEPTGATNTPGTVPPRSGTGGGTDHSVPPSPSAPIESGLPADRVTTWNPGVTYAGGGIPQRDVVCAELSPTGADDTPAIQAALDSCPDGQVVQLAPGTFQINGTGLAMTRSEITLRGSGTGTPGSGDGGTRLVKADRESNPNDAVLYVGTNAQEYGESVDLTADATLGAFTFTIDHDPGLVVGEYVLIDHVTNDDPAVVWGDHHDRPGGGSRRWFDRQDRSLSQIVEITAIDDNTITIAAPLHWTFQTKFAAQLTRYAAYAGGPVRPFVEWAGVEDLYVYGGMGGDYHGNIAISACAYCWVRNVESDFAEGTSIGLYGTYRSEIRDSYIHSTSNPNPGGGGYLTGISNGGSENLIENNIMWNGNKMIALRASGGGNVVAYNYMEDGYGAGYKQIVEVGLNATHYTTPHMELMEGNQAFNFDGDSYWGNTIDITVFRNQFTGTRRNIGGLGLTDLKNRRMIALNRYQYDYNFVGNVLGASDMKLLPGQTEFVYESDGDLDKPVVPMWQLGYVGEDPGQPFDPQVLDTVIRHGNFDYVTNDVVWDANLPETMPPSLYLSSKPAFFADLAWPWVTPENTQAPTAQLPARQRFDAMPPQMADSVSTNTDDGSDDGGSDDAASVEGAAHVDVSGGSADAVFDATFVFDEFSEAANGLLHLVWANTDGDRLVLEVTGPTVGTMTDHSYTVDIQTKDGQTFGTGTASCSLTVDEISDTSIRGGFQCEPTTDGATASGSFEVAA